MLETFGHLLSVGEAVPPLLADSRAISALHGLWVRASRERAELGLETMELEFSSCGTCGL